MAELVVAVIVGMLVREQGHQSVADILVAAVPGDEIADDQWAHSRPCVDLLHGPAIAVRVCEE